jgi:hypothetical protein
MNKLARRLGTWGAALGMLAGLVELGIGSLIRPWIGDKENPVVLGIVTLLLSGLALAATILASKRGALTQNVKLALFLGLLFPATICFTTVGRLWYLPGSLLLAAAALLANQFWMTPQPVVSTATTGRAWRLIAGLGSLMVLLSIGLAFWQSSFGLFQAEIPVRADRLRVEILPMDLVRRTALTHGTGLVEKIESSQVRNVYLCLILGAALVFIASLVASRLFSGIGGGLVLLGLLLLLAWLPGIVPGYPILLKSLGWGWYLATTGLILILSGTFWKRVR